MWGGAGEEGRGAEREGRPLCLWLYETTEMLLLFLRGNRRSRLFGWRPEIRKGLEKILHLELSARTEVKKNKIK